ncbi:MAG TPA: ATP-binding protein [Burkholderiaceae bacterium]|nr:ATP-binding protein [Burkholderiaceae bacterium]
MIGDASLKRLAERLGMDFDDSLSERVADEQLRMVWAHAEVGTLAATGFAVILAFHLKSAMGLHLIVAWLCAKVLVAVPRIVQAQVYRRQGCPGGAAWRSSTYWMLALDGAVWGVGAAWGMQAGVQTGAVVAASVVGVASVATFGLQVRLLAAAAYVVPIILPSIASLLLRADEFGVLLATGLTLVTGLLLSTAWRAEQRLSEIFLLRLHSARVCGERAEALSIARRQSAVKSQFLGTVSHELRTPLHGILGLARLVHMESGADPLIRRRMELIESSGTHLLTLINDLLDISRIEARQITLRSAVFDLAAEVDRVTDIYTVRAADKGLSFSAELELPRPCWVEGDSSRTRQVLHNLLGNAVKFTQRGWIGLRVKRVGDDLFEFEVRDTGVGIDAAEQKAIFEAFHQVGRAAGSVQGTGLGLTIAREIARVLGGDIVVQSTSGVGSVFRFSARLRPALPREEAAPAVAAPLPGRRPHILLAEDNDVNALIATSVLTHHGYEVEHVHDGREAVRRALREVDRPGLVLMDCHMPVMDGFDATREIRVQESVMSLERLPIIALTAVAADGERQQCLSAGMDDVLSKPFTADQLLLAVVQAVRPVREPARHAGALDLRLPLHGSGLSPA